MGARGGSEDQTSLSSPKILLKGHRMVKDINKISVAQGCALFPPFTNFSIFHMKHWIPLA